MSRRVAESLGHRDSGWGAETLSRWGAESLSRWGPEAHAFLNATPF
ncbi:hypothetical protein [Mycetocola sp. BIGb0189]|nr:hypothetical protein [Mycetocola sp. BIGb0189]